MKRNKHKRLGVRTAARQPDEVFSSGPLRMMRFGRHVVSQTNWPPGEFDKFLARLVAGYEEVVREIDRDIAEAAPYSPDMKINYVLIDYENVQPGMAELLVPDHFKVEGAPCALASAAFAVSAPA